MCSAAAIGTLVGGGMNFYGQKKGGDAMDNVYKDEKKNQARLRADNLNTAVTATTKSAPGNDLPVAPVASTKDEAQGLAAAVGGAGTNGVQFTGQVSRGASESSAKVDDVARRVAVLRAFGLAEEADVLEKQHAQNRIGANNLESANALALLPERLRKAGAQGAKWRMAGSALTGASGGAAGMA